jgi:hypothetical protein
LKALDGAPASSTALGVCLKRAVPEAGAPMLPFSRRMKCAVEIKWAWGRSLAGGVTSYGHRSAMTMPWAAGICRIACVWLVWLSSARPDQLIKKADRIKHF